MLVFLLLSITKHISIADSGFVYANNGESDEFNLYMTNSASVLDELFAKRSYNKNHPPIFVPMPKNFSASKTRRMKIEFMLNYVKLFDLNWRDPRLTWNETQFGGVTSVLTTSDMIWIADAGISSAKTLDVVSGLATQTVQIYSNGTISMTTPYYAETACPIYANVFPFDSQNCSIEILSLSLATEWISMEASFLNLPGQLVGNGEWDVVNASAVLFPPGLTEVMQIVTFLIIIKRVPNFYVYVIALPCFILTVLSIIGMFWTPNTKKEQLTKLSIGLTSLVSITVLMGMLADAIPKTQVFPLLGIYVVACVGITSAACVVIVMYSIPKPGKDEQKKESDLKNSKLKEAKIGSLPLPDTENQIFSATLEVRMNWRDPRLAWNSTKFGGVKSVFVTSDVLWIPDTRFGNVKTLDTVNGMSMSIAHIFSNGTVFITTAYYAESTCGIKASTFPFDKQNCSLAILSLGLESKYISYGIGIENESTVTTGNGEWLITGALPKTYPQIYTNMDIVGFLIMIKRVPNFYVYVIALPCFILTMISIIGMFWSPNIKKEQLVKLSIGLTSLVSMTVLLDMLASEIPKTQVFPLLGIYVVSCVGITSLACVIVVVHALPNPEKLTKREIEKLKEANKGQTRLRFVIESIKEFTWHRHFFLLCFFEAMNAIGFIIFLSYWED
ncbi:unnamed protein product, partial [Mesorhabditis belari]|uniref:Neurotransmitter-gated ion-channel ligand-binding domain-containing protein n=1 Tax=Mesorhabditis belari TaxID=2138241 RepID=A0AAF3EGY6_9BILA